MENYLGKNYLQYYEYEEASNLQTLGDELITPSGVDYVGPYHIHKKQGPMEGVEHISQGHRKLFYKRFYVGQIVNSLNQTGVIETGETQGIEYGTDISIDINYTPPSTENGGSSTGGGY